MTRYLDRIFPAASIIKKTKEYRTGEDTYGAYALSLDVYTPPDTDTETDRPWVVWLHGGSFEEGSKNGMSLYCKEYARRGYVAVSADYRLQQGRHPGSPPGEAAAAAQEDTLAAVEWVRARAGQLKVDSGRAIVGGFSAGAVTAAWCAYKWDQTPPALSAPPIKVAVLMDGSMIQPVDIIAGDPPMGSVRSATEWPDGPGNPHFMSLLARLDEVGIPYYDWQMPDTVHTDFLDVARIPEICASLAPFLRTHVLA